MPIPISDGDGMFLNGNFDRPKCFDLDVHGTKVTDEMLEGSGARTTGCLQNLQSSRLILECRLIKLNY